MASNKKTADERAVAPAEADLRWYFGQGASTALGDMGQRSSLGSQLARAAAGSKPKRLRRGPDGEVIPDEAVEVASGAGGSSAVGYIDVDAIERRMAIGIGAVGRVKTIEAALGRVTPTYQAVLRLAYGDRDMRPGVSHVVVLTTEARKAVAQEIGRIPNENEIGQLVAQVDARAPWLKRAQGAAIMLTDAATVAFADELASVRDLERRSGRHRLEENGFWQWKDDGRRAVGR